MNEIRVQDNVEIQVYCICALPPGVAPYDVPHPIATPFMSTRMDGVVPYSLKSINRSICPSALDRPSSKCLDLIPVFRLHYVYLPRCLYCTGQASLLYGRFAKLARKTQQNGYKIGVSTTICICLPERLKTLARAVADDGWWMHITGSWESHQAALLISISTISTITTVAAFIACLKS